MLTVNVDIFACINFRGFMKMGIFVCIKISVLSITGSLGYEKSNFQGAARKYVKRENICVHSICPNAVGVGRPPLILNGIKKNKFVKEFPPA